MELSLPPCPECGGPRAFFQCSSPAIYIGAWRRIKVYGHTCLTCGHTTLRIHPDDLKVLQKAAEKAQGKASHPCPECGGERLFFRGAATLDAGYSRSLLPRRGLRSCLLIPCTCLACGYTTERPHARDLEKLREAGA
jgi:hypothetical protein